MRTTFRISAGFLGCLAAAAASGCSGSDGKSGVNGADGGDGWTALVLVSSEPAGPNCASGGQVVAVGLDLDRNGVLDPAEVTQTKYVCNGAAGPAGDAGANGATGPRGATGPAGEAGTPGATGARGATGLQGATGATGARGATGPQGATGSASDAGSGGVRGATGPQGPAGEAGARGATGPRGATGATGAKGATGATGAKGATGSAGAKGATGATGAKGATGPAGAKGATGSAGAKGATGQAGADAACAGAAAPVVSSVQVPSGSLYAGASYQVKVSATSSRTLSYTVIGTEGTFTGGESTGTFTFVPSVAGGPFAYGVIVNDGCGVTVKAFTVPTVLPLPKLIYQSKIETNSDISAWYRINKPALVGDDVFFSYSGSSGDGHVYMDIWSIATPGSPVRESIYDGAAKFDESHLWGNQGVTVSADGTRVALRSDSSTAFLDTSTKSSPTFLAYTTSVWAPESGVISGTKVYLGQADAAGSPLYSVWDTSQNTVQSVTNTFGAYLELKSTMLIGGYLYFATISSPAQGLLAFDSTQFSSTPAYTEGSDNATGLALHGSNLLVAENNSLKIFDVSSPAAPSALGQVAIRSNDVAYANNFAFVTTSTGISLVDVTQPTVLAINATKSSSDLSITTGETIQSITIDGSKAVVLTRDTNSRNRLYLYLLQ